MEGKRKRKDYIQKPPTYNPNFQPVIGFTYTLNTNLTLLVYCSTAHVLYDALRLTKLRTDFRSVLFRLHPM